VKILLSYICFEILFYLSESLRFARISRSRNVSVNTLRMSFAMEQFGNLKNLDVKIEDFLEGWFMGSKISDIHDENMVEFIAYGFYSKNAEELTASEKARIKSFLRDTCDTYGISFVEGYNPDVKFMGHTIEPIRAFHKPLLLYLLMELVGMCSHGVLYCYGFRKMKQGGITKWIYRPRMCDDTKTPIVFLHGIGLGVLPYIHFIISIISMEKNRLFMLVEMRHVTMRVYSDDAPNLTSLANDIVDAMKYIGYEKGIFIAHSYGTFVLSQILQSRNSSVEQAFLIDPVCLMTCHPKLTSNFVYRNFQGPPVSFKRFMDLVQFVFSRDLTLAQTFCRRFNGMEIMIWPEDLPKHVKNVIVLSGQDPLIPTDLVQEQFKEVDHTVIVVNSNHTHGQFLSDFQYLKYLVNHVVKKHIKE
jgi:pimeloyl-ACP methyl ester carboxylesterase